MIEQSHFFELITQGDLDPLMKAIEQQPESVDFKDANGVTAVLWAYYTAHPEIGNRLIEQGAQVSLFEAAAAGRIQELTGHLAEQPEHVNDFSPDGFQALGYACFFGQNEAARLLVAAGADINSPSKNSMRLMPLHSAVANRNLEIAELLLRRGAQVNAVQAAGFTPLHAAGQHGQLEMIDLLLAWGADPSVKSEDGSTPAGLARKHGHSQAAAMLRIELVHVFSDELMQAVEKLMPQLTPFSAAPTKENLQEMLKNPETRLWIARDEEGRIAGMLTLAMYRSPSGKHGWIEDVVVDENARGKGYGEMLTRVATRHAVRCGVKAVSLTSRSQRVAANQLYQKLGFERVETNLYRKEMGHQ